MQPLKSLLHHWCVAHGIVWSELLEARFVHHGAVGPDTIAHPMSSAARPLVTATPEALRTALQSLVDDGVLVFDPAFRVYVLADKATRAFPFREWDMKEDEAAGRGPSFARQPRTLAASCALESRDAPWAGVYGTVRKFLCKGERDAFGADPNFLPNKPAFRDLLNDRIHYTITKFRNDGVDVRRLVSSLRHEARDLTDEIRSRASSAELLEEGRMGEIIVMTNREIPGGADAIDPDLALSLIRVPASIEELASWRVHHA